MNGRYLKAKVAFAGVVVVTALFCATGDCGRETAQDRVEILVTAASRGDIRRVKAIFCHRRSSKLANGLDRYGHTALGDATWWNHPSVARYLISRGADVNGRDRHGRTPLHMAAEKGYVDLVKILIACGASVKAKDADRQTPLHPAAYEGHNEVIRLLLAAGGKALGNARDKQGRNALLVAMASNSADKETIKLLLDAESDVNCSKTTDRWTPLHYAAQSGDDETVALLLDRGANMNARTNEGWTALWLAAYWRNRSVAYLLIRRGSPPDIFSAVDLGDKTMVETLLDTKPALLDVRDYCGATPLHEAAERGEKGIAEILLARGAQVNAKDYSRSTPLRAAIEKKHSEVVLLLRTHGGS